MLAGDGRVRVLDFGLSRLYATEDLPAPGPSGGALEWTVTGAGHTVGTPAYMSPEQHDREEVDARSDQFSFCLALWEALYGQRPFAGETVDALAANMRKGDVTVPSPGARVPAWVRRALERGLQVEPALRWPTMDELLAALSRDPERTRRRLLAAGAAVVAVAGLSYGAAAYRVAEAQVCSGAAEEIGAVWDADRRAALEQAMRATGVAYAERSLAASAGLFDAYAEKWAAVHTASCTAHQRRHISPQLYDRRMACLRQRQRELRTTVEVLTQTARETAPQAVDAVRGLPPVSLCEDDERLLAAVAPPEDARQAAAVEATRERLALLQALERGGRYEEALASVRALVKEAERLGFLPLRAEVELLAGKLHVHKVQAAEARVSLDRALRLAIESRDDEIAAEALILQIFNTAVGERRTAEALEAVPLAWSLVRRVGSPPLLAARLHHSVGTAYHEQSDEARAIEELGQALELLVKHTPEDPLRWATSNNLAMALHGVGRDDQAGALAADALAQLERQYDVCHPHAAALQLVVAEVAEATGAFDRAVAGYERALTCFSGYPVHAVVTLYELGRLQLLRGEPEEAKRQIARADELLALYPDTRSRAQEIELLRADVAIAGHERGTARRILEGLAGTSGGLQQAAASRLGLLAYQEHDDERALAHLQQATALLGPEQPGGERGLYAFTLARVLQALGREPERTQALLQQAAEAYGRAGAPYAARAAEIRAWQANAGGPR